MKESNSWYIYDETQGHTVYHNSDEEIYTIHFRMGVSLSDDNPVWYGIYKTRVVDFASQFKSI